MCWYAMLFPKETETIPLHKTGDSHLFQSYCTKARSPTISKV